MNRVVLFIGALCTCILAGEVHGIPSVYDGFDYANDGSPLSGQEGGYGWSGAWTEAGDGAGDNFTLTQAETSLDLPMLPFDPVGDSVIAAGPGSGSNNNTITRSMAGGFDLGIDQTFYASYLMVKSGSASSSSDNMEMDMMSGGSRTLRLGSTSSDLFWLGTSSNQIGPITFDDTYFVVVKVEAVESGDDVASMIVFDSTESIPGTDPGAFDATYNFSSSATINGAQLWIGTNASGMYDELRFGSTWQDVTSVNPNFLLGDFDLMDGITLTDYQTLSDNMYTGTTYEQGDMNFSGLVDLADFALFREAYVAQGGSLSDLGIVSVPEPSTAMLVGLASVAAILYTKRLPLK